MKGIVGPPVRALLPLLIAAVFSVSAASAAAQATTEYKGRPLVDALRLLQAQGLRIVFTSAIVTREMRVQVEPRTTTPRRQLDELLAPHGLEARSGPGGILQIVRAAPVRTRPVRPVTGAVRGSVVDGITAAPLAGVTVRVDGVNGEVRTDTAGRFRFGRLPSGSHVVHASTPGYLLASQPLDVVTGTTVSVTLTLTPATSTHREYVTVTESTPYRRDRGVAAETHLNRGQLNGLYGSRSDDPIRAVHMLPGVIPVDEFHSEFAVRGSAFRHTDFVIDGVTAEWLLHTAPGRGATGSLGMFTSQVLEEATIRAGAYPRRHGSRLGPQLELTTREGSRHDTTVRGALGNTNGTVVGEGPLGHSARGSWLFAARHSFLEWPTEQEPSTRTAFAYVDGLAKLVYDVRPSQRIALSVAGGESTVDAEDNVAPNALGNGRNRAAIVNVAWRSAFGRAVFTQRAAMVRHHFLNNREGGRDDRGTNERVLYRADVTRPLGRSLLEAGLHVGRQVVDDAASSPQVDRVTASSLTRSLYAHVAWGVTPTLTLSPGLRTTSSTHTPDTAVTRWLLAEWTFSPHWALTGSTGIAQQLPELRHAAGGAQSLYLRPERAMHIDVGIEHRWTSSGRWRATVFTRGEEDILREPDLLPRLVAGRTVAPETAWVTALEGTSRGIELLVERDNAIGLSGWATYSYGRTRYTDFERQEAFWGNLDQRHSITLSGAYQFSRGSVGAAFRAGSNFPIPAYLSARDGGVFVGAQRNTLRLPPYARLDLRGDREVAYFGTRMRLFLEMLNVLNRANAGLAGGSVDMQTGEAIGVTDALFGRRMVGGLLFEF
jgi:hypothetical protein